jgi:hypothetical protein
VAWFKPGQQKPTTKVSLTSLSADQIQTIRIARANGDGLSLARTGTQWRLTAPRTGRANAQRVQTLLGLLAADSLGQPAAGKRAEYGLDTPRASVWYDDNEIRIGREHAFDPEVYAEAGGTVHLIAMHAADAALTPPDDFRDPHLLDEDMQLVEIQTRDFRATQSDNGAWSLIPPVKNLSTDAINGFVDEWRYAQALSVTVGDGRRPIDHVTLRERRGAGKDAVTTTLKLGIIERSPELIIHRPDENLDYHFPRETADRLLNPGPTGAGTPGG